MSTDQADIKPSLWKADKEQGQFAAALDTIRDMLQQLAIGDPNVRISLPAGIPEIKQLEAPLNNVATSLQELVDESHETAMGLCEHYETLLHLTHGALDARAAVDSRVELIAKLGQLINNQTSTFMNVIDRQKGQERQLLALNERLAAIIDFLPDATFVIDTDYRVIAWNRALEEMTGIPKEAILGTSDYAVPFYGSRRPALIDFIIDDTNIINYNYNFMKRQGKTIVAEGALPPLRGMEERIIWIAASPLINAQGEMIGAIESVRDISDYKRSEKEREQLREQLHHVQKLDSIGQLAGGIAHEFNNVLAAILGYAGILEKRLGADSPHQSALQRIIISAEKASSLTREMLAFSRKQLMTSETICLGHLVYEMKEMLCRLAGENITVDFNLGDGEQLIEADLGQMQQVILNLYNNARDAMPDGGTLSISLSRHTVAGGNSESQCAPPCEIPTNTPPGNYVVMKLSDTGSGIKSEHFDRIFDPFFTTKEVGKGTGLGLAMVFGIIQQHKGHIKVITEPGKGTTFCIWLPEKVREQPKPLQADPIFISGNGHGTILVGEDNDDVRPMIVELLEEAGYRVLEAADGVQVTEMMSDRGKDVDLLLLDVMMPRMNGKEALDVVRIAYPELPCIFLSGYSDDIISQKAKVPGRLGYLVKPISPAKLLQAVQEALGHPLNTPKST